MLTKLAKIIAAIVVLLVVVAIALPLFLKPASLRAPLLHELEVATGYSISIGGDISIRILPSPELKAGDVTIKSPKSAAPFAKIQELEVGVRLLPLLHGNVEMTRLLLKAPALTLVQSGGQNNWQSATAASAPPPAAVTGKDTNKKPNAAKGIFFQQVEISDGVLQFTDAGQHQSINVSVLNLKADMPSIAAPLTFTAKAVWNSKPLAVNMKLGSVATVLNNNKSPLTFTLDSEALTVKAEGLLDPVQYTGKTVLESKSLTEALTWLSGTRPAAGVTPIALHIEGDAACSVVQCGVNDATIKVNDMVLTGAAKVNLMGAKPEITADISTKLLDISPFLAKKTASLSLIHDAVADSARWSNAPIDLSALQMANGTLNLKADRLVANGLTVDHPIIRAKLDRGTLSADMINAALYKGQAAVSMNLMVDGRLDGRISATNVQMQPLLLALMQSDRFSGTGTMQLSFTSSGKSVYALVSNLGGSGNAQLTGGSFKGADIGGMIRNVQSAFIGGNTAGSKTEFSELAGSFTIANGIITNNDLALKSSLFRAGGKGTVNLPNYTLNYLLTPQMVEAAKEGIAVPIRISGSLDNPGFAPDAQAVLQDALKDPKKFKETLKNTKEMLKDKNSIKNLKGLLKGL